MLTARHQLIFRHRRRNPLWRTGSRQRAGEILPDARLEIIPGRHAPFLDDAARCGALIDELLRRVTPSPP